MIRLIHNLLLLRKGLIQKRELLSLKTLIASLLGLRDSASLSDFILRRNLHVVLVHLVRLLAGVHQMLLTTVLQNLEASSGCHRLCSQIIAVDNFSSLREVICFLAVCTCLQIDLDIARGRLNSL